MGRYPLSNYALGMTNLPYSKYLAYSAVAYII